MGNQNDVVVLFTFVFIYFQAARNV